MSRNWLGVSVFNCWEFSFIGSMIIFQLKKRPHTFRIHSLVPCAPQRQWLGTTYFFNKWKLNTEVAEALNWLGIQKSFCTTVFDQSAAPKYLMLMCIYVYNTNHNVGINNPTSLTWFGNLTFHYPFHLVCAWLPIERLWSHIHYTNFNFFLHYQL